jgi:D-xylose 1-dehydrogenase (NADP+, D-xylono-1,5-lactone-forming)
MSAEGRRPVRWGLLGTGNITRKLLHGASGTTTAEVVAIGSRDRDRAASFAAANGIARPHGSYEALLADPDVDAVYISLPNGLHHGWTMHALAAGKHVLCEKPYTRHPEEVEEAFDAAEAGGLVLSEAFMWRHHPQVGMLRSIVAEIGPLQLIRATFSFVLEDEADVRLQADLDGGSLMDVGCYCVSGARLLAGEEPSEVVGVAEFDETGVDRRFTGILRFPDAVIAEFSSGFTSNHRGLEAIGRDGSVLATDPWQSSPATIWRDGVETVLDPVDPYTLELEDMAAAIRGERPALLGRADALGQARTIEALYRSAETGAAVRL